MRGARLALAILVIAVAYAAAARLGLRFAAPPDFKATPIWPASGIAVAGLLLFGWRAWPGVFIGAFVGNVLDFFGPANSTPLIVHSETAMGIAIGSTLQALLAWKLMDWYIPDHGVLKSARAVSKFILITAFACIVAPSIGLAASALAGLGTWQTLSANWITWWIGDVVGIYIVAALIMSWKQRAVVPATFDRVLEGIAIMLLVFVTSMLVFGGWRQMGPFGGALPYMTLPPIILAKFRLGPQGSMTALLVLAAVAVWGTSQGHGAFVGATWAANYAALQAFLGITAITVLIVVGVLAERRAAEEAKLQLIGELELALEEIKQLRGILPICAWCHKIRNDFGAWQQIEAYIAKHTGAEFTHGICPECAEEMREREAQV